ncbi:MAG: hypothetical protein WCQ69_08280 [Bacteroidales bacterium]|jgi:primosomal protein N'|nr:hypothetical protein [Bacteroidales bacterium]MDD2264177.1 hypothetical protein [Bacteroidales bacterium]MDD2831352.1 hypothetical protein [Bacteroidales bacterium]MDD3208346.1 hypothetical protein [Bacteroidales bacterium]MDD3696971.1 hypothetical protein [Bacteroidales bacterium]
MNQKFADILFPLALEGILTYRIPKEIEDKAVRGSQIKAPLGNRIYTGVICSIRQEPATAISGDEIKDILTIETALPTIPESTLRFWSWIAGYYMCPKGLVLKMAFSLWKFKRRAVPMKQDPGPLPQPGLPLYVQGVDRTGFYTERIREVLAAGGQCLIITPDRLSCEMMYESLLPELGEHLICFHSKRTRKEQSHARKELYAGNPCVITGMHLSLLLPFTRLGLIVIDREEHPGHKRTDAAPLMNARDTALMMGQICHAQVILGSCMPSLETLFNTGKGKYRYMKIYQDFPQIPSQAVIIDTSRSFAQKGMRGLFDIRTRQALEESLNGGHTVLLVEGDPSVTEDYPQDQSIIVCKPSQMHHYLVKNIGMICFLHTEKLLSRKHFRATEQTCHIVGNALRWAAIQDPQVPVHVQTAGMDHPFYHSLTEGFPHKFFTSLLEERKQYGYPPFSRLILLTVSHHRRLLAQTKAGLLTEYLTAANLPVLIEGPFIPGESIRLQFSFRLQITVSRSVKIQEVKERLFSIVRQTPLAPARCRIDVDPV